MPELYTIVTESRSRSPKITDLDENHNLKTGTIDNNFKINSTSKVKDEIFKIDSKELIKIGPFFEGLMRHSCKETIEHRINLTGCSTETFQKMIDLVHNEQARSDFMEDDKFGVIEDIEEILDAANLYQVKIVIQICQDKLLKITRLHDYASQIKCLMISRIYSLTSLENYAFQILSKNFSKIPYQLLFALDSDVDLLIELLERDDLEVDENELLNFVWKWFESERKLNKQFSLDPTNLKRLVLTVRQASLKPVINCLEKFNSMIEHALELLMFEVHPTKFQLKIECQLRKINLDFVRYFTRTAQQPILLKYLPLSSQKPRNQGQSGQKSQFHNKIHLSIDGVCTDSTTTAFPLPTRNSTFCKFSENLENTDPTHTLISIENSKFVYCLGGTRKSGVNSKSAFRLDMLNNKKLEIPEMGVIRSDFAAVAVDDEFIYVFGGYDERRSPLKSCERYSILKNKWEQLDDIPCDSDHRRGLAGMTATRVKNKIYVIGGFSKMESNEEVYEFDLKSGEFCEKPVCRLWFARGGHVVYSDKSGTGLWVIGGVDGPHAGRVVGQIEYFDFSKVKSGSRVRSRLASRVICQGPFEKPLRLNLLKVENDENDEKMRNSTCKNENSEIDISLATESMENPEESFFVTSVEKYDCIRFRINNNKISCEYIDEGDSRSPVIYSYKLDD